MIFPRPNESFGFYIFRTILLVVAIGALLIFLGNYSDKIKVDTDPPQKEWTGYDPTRPVSDISHRDYTNKVIYYRPKGDYVPTETEKQKQKKKSTERAKKQTYRDPTDEEILEYIRNNEGDFDIEEIYDKYRD